MNQESRTGFFHQYFIACFQPRNYRMLLNKKKGSHILYMCLLMLFLLFIDTVIPIAAWTTSVGGLKNLFLERIPSFTLENGSFAIASPLSFELGQAIRVEINSEVEAYEQTAFQEKYQEEILVGKSNVLVRAGNRMAEVPLSSLKQTKINNHSLVASIPYIVALFFCYCMFCLVGKGVQYVVIAMIFGMICRAGVRSPDGKFVSAREAFLIAFYAKTLFAIISSINACMGYMISSFWMTMISVMIIMSYIYKAEVSVLKKQEIS